jgi:hypothetical protein
MVEGWELIKTEFLEGHKITRFRFKSNQEFIVGGIKAHKIREIHAKTDGEAWMKLKEWLRNKLA